MECTVNLPDTEKTTQAGTCIQADGDSDSTEPHPRGPLHLQCEDTSPLVQLLLDSLQYTSRPDFISEQLTEEEYKGKIKAWNESTSTSPTTNMHLGHLKAYWADHTLPENSEEAQTLQQSRQQILQGHLALLNYAIRFGHPFQPWTHIVNTMLEKDPGSPKIHRLRVIHLYEADYDLILGVKWHQALHHACSQSYINPGCYGSQPDKEAMDALIIRELEYEMSRLTCKPCIHFDNDATSCYDRIPCFLANLASRKYGMNKKICIVQGKTLKEAKYHLKTKLGISDDFIQHSQAYPIYGTGQGSGNSPTYWLLISSTLFDMYDRMATGSKYATPDRTVSLVLRAIGFVDDVRTTTNAFDDASVSVPTLTTTAETNDQLWHDILTTTNQALELSKCGYHIIAYDFKPDGAPTLIEEQDSQITIRDTQARPLPIQQWPNTMATKYLGAYKCVANQSKQGSVLKAQCNHFAKVIHSSHLTRRETQVFYWSIYRLSMNYVLPSTYFTKDEISKIQSTSHSAMVARMGYCRTTPRAVIFGSKRYGGVGLFHLYDDQGWGQLKTFIKFWRSPSTQAGKLLRIVISWCQYCVGTKAGVLQDVHSTWPHFESRWISSLRQYLLTISGHLELTNHGSIPHRRMYDAHIMDVVLTCGHFKPAAIRKINYCRMYLNVLLLSDIVMPCGTRLDPAAYEGTRALYFTTPNHYVHQTKPGKKSWKCWRKLLNSMCKPKQRLTLIQHLGAWQLPSYQLSKHWPFFIDPTNDTVYQRTGTNFSTHKRITYDYDKDISQRVDGLPATAVPVFAIL